MSAETDQRAESLFYEAIELLAGERDGFLDNACGADAGLLAEVDELLRLHGEAAGFLPEDAAASPDLEWQFGRSKPEQVGDRIGPYKLLEQIGEGGFGTVWVAEQEKPMRRRVALKIIKLGMDTKEVIARFEQERQALAMMEHPNIARVLDAGATPFGRPFFVMELVRGIKITEYCDRANLPTAERLQLFVAVCHAVQHAHQKGIIHRDLKPSNILVTMHDGVPVPKVIDFGVAKATQQQRLTDLTVYTQFEQMVGTPLYMSPEQAEMTGLDIDTRSDIYSLGVLLYELLVGRTPFDPESLMKRGLDEIRRAVREQEPQKPSTFVSTMAVDLRTNLALRRQTESARLIGQIRGDLDWIVMKALEKDRARRYETATGLAQDIQRHLLSEPVQARPASNLYRFRRFAKRNKVGFAAASAVLAALIIGLGVSTWMFFKEKHARGRAIAAEQEQVRLRELSVAAEKAQSEERIKAETEASKSRQVAQFLTDMLNGVGPSVALGRDTKMLQEILDKTAERVGNDLKDQPAVEADLRSIIGEVYCALGDYVKAGAMHTEALAMTKKLLGNEHPYVAASLNSLAQVLCKQGKLAEAETMHREALAMCRKLLGNEHPNVANSLNNLAQVLCKQGNLAEAETMHREALAMCRKLLGNEHPNVATALNNLAVVLSEQRKLAEAEPMFREALAMQRKLLGNEHPEVATALNNLAAVLSEQGKLAEAETMSREALAMKRKLLGNEHPAVADSLKNLAQVLGTQGKLAEAETMHREALAMRRKLLGGEHPDVANSLNSLAVVLSEQRKLAEAEPMFREALAMRRKLLGGEHPDVANSLYSLARALFKQGKLAEAETMSREVLAMHRKLLGNEHPEVATALNSLAVVLGEQGKPAEAETMSREALAMQRKLLGNEHPDVADSLSTLAYVLRKQRKLAEAETMSREVLAMRRKLLGNEHPVIANSLNSLAVVLGEQGKLAEAETMSREALAMKRKLLGNEHPAVADSLKNLASLLRDQGRLTEIEPLYREALAIARKSAASDAPGLDVRLIDLAEYLFRQSKYAEAEQLYREVIKSQQVRLAAEDNKILGTTASLGRLLADWAWSERSTISEIQNTKSKITERAGEAEHLLRDCLAIRLRGAEATHWRTTGEAPSRLGGALLAVAVTDPALTSEARGAKFTEAESLLLQGNEVLQQDEKVDSKYQRDSFTRLVRLYDAWAKADKAAAWQQKLTDFEKKAKAMRETENEAVSPGP